MIDTAFATVASDTLFLAELLVPKLTDIRGNWNGNAGDLVECPAGSKRFYQLKIVDDVAKGFPNEYRLGFMVYLETGYFTFPAPVPLP